MTIKVQVKRVNQTGTLIASNPVTVATKISLNSTNKLVDLLDVEPDYTPEAGEVPVYEPSKNKYVIEKLDIDQLVGDINDVDGGTF